MIKLLNKIFCIPELPDIENPQLDSVSINQTDSDYEDSSIDEKIIDQVYKINSGRTYIFPTEHAVAKTFSIQLAINKYKNCNGTQSRELFIDVLDTVKTLGFFPVGLSLSADDMLKLLKVYNLSEYHQYFEGKLSVKFEMIAKAWKAQASKGSIHSEGIDENGQSLVHHAVKCKNIPFLEHLLTQGCDPNRIDNYGKTPIFYTFGKKHKDGQAVILLVKYGANLNIPYKGKTWVEMAKIKHNNRNLAVVNSMKKDV